MKKFVIGLIVGLAIAGATSAVAASRWVNGTGDGQVLCKSGGNIIACLQTNGNYGIGIAGDVVTVYKRISGHMKPVFTRTNY